jgi:hypothetical protein
MGRGKCKEGRGRGRREGKQKANGKKKGEEWDRGRGSGRGLIWFIFRISDMLYTTVIHIRVGWGVLSDSEWATEIGSKPLFTSRERGRGKELE